MDASATPGGTNDFTTEESEAPPTRGWGRRGRVDGWDGTCREEWEKLFCGCKSTCVSCDWCTVLLRDETNGRFEEVRRCRLVWVPIFLLNGGFRGLETISEE